jgi:transcriptional regulator with XRE-family HTH domain
MARPRNGVRGEADTPAKLFGKLLARLRETAGLTQAALAQAAPIRREALARIETGAEVPGEDTVRALGRALGAEQLLISMWAAADWYPEAAVPDWFQHYVRLERKAESVHEWFPYSIPSLLQTEGYMRQQLRLGGFAPARVDELTKGRMARQALLYGESPLRLVSVIDGAALFHHLGNAEIMRDQLAHLLHMGSLPNVMLQVVPAGVVLPALLETTTELLTLRDGAQWFYTEAADHGWLTEDKAEAASLRRHYDQLRGAALSVSQTRELIRRTMGALINVTPPLDLSKLSIFKSSYSGGQGACVGASRDLLSLDLVPVVDTTLGLDSPVLGFTKDAFSAFVQAVKAGEFSL